MFASNLNFRRQLHYPGDVEVTANATRIGTKSFTLAYAIRELSTGEVAADGESVCVWVDYEQARALPLPAALVDAICELEQNPDLAAGTK